MNIDPVTAVTTEKDTAKKKSSFLKKDVRDNLIAQLKALDVATEGLDDEELLKKLSETASFLNKKVVDGEVASLEKKLATYKSPDSRLTDPEFLQRLYHLNVPSYYLHLFRDQDKDLTDKEIWQIIRKSGINPIKNTVDVFKTYRNRRVA